MVRPNDDQKNASAITTNGIGPGLVESADLNVSTALSDRSFSSSRIRGKPSYSSAYAHTSPASTKQPPSISPSILHTQESVLGKWHILPLFSHTFDRSVSCAWTAATRDTKLRSHNVCRSGLHGFHSALRGSRASVLWISLSVCPV